MAIKRQSARRALEQEMAVAVREARDSISNQMMRRAVELGAPVTLGDFMTVMDRAWRSAIVEIDGATLNRAS